MSYLEIWCDYCFTGPVKEESDRSEEEEENKEEVTEEEDLMEEPEVEVEEGIKEGTNKHY